MRVVDRQEWILDRVQDPRRRERLLGEAPSPQALIEQVAACALSIAEKAALTPLWQHSDECWGRYRIVLPILLNEYLFDWFFNGPSGYRAQYYLSEEEGKAFNDATLNALEPAAMAACIRYPLPVPWKQVRQSLLGAHSKVWLWGDGRSFATAEPHTLMPARWAQYEGIATRAPMPSPPAIELKGTFIHPQSGEDWLPEEKEDRHKRLHERGFT